MTGFDSKRQAAQNKMNDAADTLSIVYQRGFADGKKAAQPEQEPVAYDKTELNRFVQDLYDEKMQEGHGHYETMFHVVHQAVHQAIKKVAPPAAQPVQQAEPLTATTIGNMMPSTIPTEYDGALMEFARAIEAAHNIKEGT